MATYTVNFYNMTENIHVVDKSPTLIASFTCNIKEPIDVEHPEIFVSTTNADILKANYCYIAGLGRYYSGHIEGERGQTVRFIADESDVLMSFKTGLLNSPAVIARNPWHFDLYLPDPKMPVETRTASAVFAFPASFDDYDNCYILTTLGSG